MPIKRHLTQIKDSACSPQYVSQEHAHPEDAMLRLASLLHSLISTSLAGTFIIVALVAGQVTLYPIIAAAIAGFVIAAPVSWLVARQLYN